MKSIWTKLKMLEIFQRIFLKKENAVVIDLFKVEYLIKLDKIEYSY